VHSETSLIATIAVGLAFAFAGGFAAVRLGLPPVVGYLLAGIAVGPFTPGFVGDAALAPQLAEIGAILWRGIPEEIRPATLFTVDGVVDDEQQIWLLEMNCNPVLHPDAYPLMFETLFGPAELSAELEMPAPPPVSALPVPAMALAARPLQVS